MIVAVLDTNVLVSGFPARAGVPAALIGAWREGGYQLVVSEPILEELAEAWQDPYWQSRFSQEEGEQAIALLLRAAIVTPLTVEITGVATHSEDDLILATAVASSATYLVTGDRKLQAIGIFEGVTILSPRAFLMRLAWGEEAILQTRPNRRSGLNTALAQRSRQVRDRQIQTNNHAAGCDT